MQVQFLGEKFPGEKCVQEGFEESLGETYIKKYVQEEFFLVKSLWVKRICKKSIWVKGLCARRVSG